ncbi:TIR-like protein FxsC [Phytohabitans sp. ZYX-F-186]|uniref:TIR-like protein FxsC n=1 Tax=Phytohabitans maris TaxID=3071409 RepID=A0ABU0Z883_9ACTN|nr:TIR-like protein FxsC [Phytohabitans sp. ZYX-F-186]MDQ7903253.1 TIR-like protein FxsC [Phytohabitans sp. ZYX-F-186]
MNGDEFELEPGMPLFFLSYAHVNATRGEVNRFFEDLSTDVNELVGRSVGADPGFMDSVMSGGEHWSPELLRATGTCQVFVPLISASLVRSSWCGMEWDAFARRKRVRRQDRRADNATGIVPVRWSPTELVDLPAVVQKIQWFSPGRLPDPKLPALYEQAGLYGLLKLGLDREYRAVVWWLAQHVVGIFRSHWVTAQIPSGPEELRNVFDEEVT